MGAGEERVVSVGGGRHVGGSCNSSFVRLRVRVFRLVKEEDDGKGIIVFWHNNLTLILNVFLFQFRNR